jgi:hypothetical protein
MATVSEPVQVSSHTVDKVTKAKLTLENYYSTLVTQHEERESRYAILSVTHYSCAICFTILVLFSSSVDVISAMMGSYALCVLYSSPDVPLTLI